MILRVILMILLLSGDFPGVRQFLKPRRETTKLFLNVRNFAKVSKSFNKISQNIFSMFKISVSCLIIKKFCSLENSKICQFIIESQLLESHLISSLGSSIFSSRSSSSADFSSF